MLREILTTKRSIQRLPIWFMRQAGRYLPEYQKVMSDVQDFLEACYTPEIVEVVTLQPIQRFDLDAAIIFSDIMTVPDALGFGVTFKRGYGPQINKNTRREVTLDWSLKKVSPVLESIKRVRKSLPPNKSLIGFAGSPWTVATYILGQERKITDIFALHRSGDNSVAKLIDEIVSFTTVYLEKQIEYGADVLQLFDSNSAGLPVDLFETFVVEPTRKIVKELKKQYPSIPIIGFPKGAGVLYPHYAITTGVSAVSVDYSIPSQWIKNNISGVIQGNLDPFLLAYDVEGALKCAAEIITNLRDKPLIFNLGHGIIPSTPADNVHRLVDFVRSF
ncbi:uroporphyrinogen decarboxylase [Anaplasma phagocytophilum]|uniref:uroporphyrinogen decarboxylase n=1 Tax=Anaplasma phagocytophilum TaxID=948 RepID=UPI0031F837C6